MSSPSSILTQRVMPKGMTPAECIAHYDDKEWEEFVNEWANGMRATHGYEIVDIVGGSGDKGVDVVGYLGPANVPDTLWDNYQCKHYAKPLQPANPYRSSELHVRRQMIEKGIAMMLSKSIIECTLSTTGFTYRAGTWALAFLSALQAPYTHKLAESAKWVVSRFGMLSDNELAKFLNERWEKWGPEFGQAALSLTTTD
jgi:hypothetical protein